MWIRVTSPENGRLVSVCRGPITDYDFSMFQNFINHGRKTNFGNAPPKHFVPKTQNKDIKCNQEKKKNKPSDFSGGR